MGTFFVQKLLSRVATKLYDETGVTWAPEELLADYNGLKNTVVALKPEAGAQTIVLDLVSGSLQACPANVVVFRKLTRNMGADGATAGQAIRAASKADMDHGRPGWHTEAGEYVKHFIADPEHPLSFYVWPVVDVEGSAAWSVEAVVCATFDDVVYPDQETFCFPDAYEECLLYGHLALAYAKDRKTQDLSKVAFWQNAFNQFLGLKGEREFRFKPQPPKVEQQIGS